MSNNVTVYINKDYPLNSDKMFNFKNKIGLDLSFQSEARWDPKQKSDFITSLIKGMAPSRIIIANIESCLEESTEDSLCYNYFTDWLNRGKEGISIDGNNRTITIDEYLNDKVAIEHGEYNLSTGTVVIKEDNDRFNTHPKLLKEHINNNIRISICEYVKSTRSDLSELFKNINNGVPLNAQELRNATLVPFAEEVRNLAKEYGSAFKYIFKTNGRRAMDEQIVNMSVYYTYGAAEGITKKDKDTAYDDNSTVWKNFKGAKKAIEETLKMVDKYANAGFKDVSTLMNLFIAVTYLQKEKRNIVDKERFFKWFMATENARVADSTKLVETKTESRDYEGCNTSTSDVYLVARYNYILKDLQSISSNIVTSVDPERLFSRAQRYEMWSRQGGVCPRTGKVIPEEDINNHELWAADHVIPYSKGGPTTIENGELVCRDYNQNKGAKMPELMVA
jgi:5-methylcytosine-specific restriction endonuclease McrA